MKLPLNPTALRRAMRSPRSFGLDLDPIRINHDPTVCHFKPWEHMYCAFNRDPVLNVFFQARFGSLSP